MARWQSGFARSINFPVLLDESNLAGINVLLASDPVSDRLDDQPLYLLLESASIYGTLDWYVEDEILWITTT